MPNSQIRHYWKCMVDLTENYLQIPRGGRVRNDTDAGLLIPKRKRNRKLPS